MKKKIISILLCAALSISLLAGCGGSKENSESTEESVSEGTTEEITEEAAETTEDSDELNEYGLTNAQQEALLTEVKNSVTEEYLSKYDINPSEFKLHPYDVNDLKNYDESGNYIGADPEECTKMWNVIDKTILWTNGLGDRFVMGVALGDMDLIKDQIKDSGLSFEDTLDAQNEKNKENGAAWILDTSSQKYSLMNGVYMGIAKFLNGLDEEERIDVICNLYEVMEENSEEVDINGYSYKTTTMFDKVISENIQF